MLQQNQKRYLQMLVQREEDIIKLISEMKAQLILLIALVIVVQNLELDHEANQGFKNLNSKLIKVKEGQLTIPTQDAANNTQTHTAAIPLKNIEQSHEGSGIRFFGPYGGATGASFSVHHSSYQVRQIFQYGSRWVSSLQLIYTPRNAWWPQYRTVWFGKHEGSFHQILINPSQYIRTIYVDYRYYVDRVTFVTNTGHLQSFGNNVAGTHRATINLNANQRLIGIFGRAGDHIDALGFVVKG